MNAWLVESTETPITSNGLSSRRPASFLTAHGIRACKTEPSPMRSGPSVVRVPSMRQCGMRVCGASGMFHLHQAILPVHVQVDGDLAKPILGDERASVPKSEPLAFQMVVFPQRSCARQPCWRPLLEKLPHLGPVSSFEDEDAAGARQQPGLILGSGRAEPAVEVKSTRQFLRR